MTPIPSTRATIDTIGRGRFQVRILNRRGHEISSDEVRGFINPIITSVMQRGIARDEIVVNGERQG